MDMVTGAIFFVALTSTSFYAGGHGEITNTCYNEPVRLVTKEVGTYNVEVAGCEYQANKDSYTLIKTL